jgi:hypothetical protein
MYLFGAPSIKYFSLGMVWKTLEVLAWACEWALELAWGMECWWVAATLMAWDLAECMPLSQSGSHQCRNFLLGSRS